MQFSEQVTRGSNRLSENNGSWKKEVTEILSCWEVFWVPDSLSDKWKAWDPTARLCPGENRINVEATEALHHYVYKDKGLNIYHNAVWMSQAYEQ